MNAKTQMLARCYRRIGFVIILFALSESAKAGGEYNVHWGTPATRFDHEDNLAPVSRRSVSGVHKHTAPKPHYHSRVQRELRLRIPG